MKILYVCPFAHYSGHHPHVSVVEPKYLKGVGMDVDLLTFSGIINEAKAGVPHYRVVSSDSFLNRMLSNIRRKTLPRWVLMFLEMAITINKAIKMKRKHGYDVIHLRDGEPFIFLSHLLGLPYKNLKWLVSLTATAVFRPKIGIKDIYSRPSMYLYAVVLSLFINNRIWRILYRISMKRNTHIYTPQNKVAEDEYKGYHNGIFKDYVTAIELGVGDMGNMPRRLEARNHFGITEGAFVLLSFGAPNAGKDLETMFKAVSMIPKIYLLHGGTHTYSLGGNPVYLAKKYNLGNRAIIVDNFVSEEEKLYFFAASDAIILSYTNAFASTSSMMWEAARYGLPCISSNANTLGKDVDKYKLGLLFDAEDCYSLKDSIEQYRHLSREIIQDFKYNCENFTNLRSDAMWAKECIEVYERLLK